jgi:hypothetical protein
MIFLTHIGTGLTSMLGALNVCSLLINPSTGDCPCPPLWTDEDVSCVQADGQRFCGGYAVTHPFA